LNNYNIAKLEAIRSRHVGLSALSDAGTRILAILVRTSKVDVAILLITWIACVEHTRIIFESTRCRQSQSELRPLIIDVGSGGHFLASSCFVEINGNFFTKSGAYQSRLGCND
jgi:hypothetical protein